MNEGATACQQEILPTIIVQTGLFRGGGGVTLEFNKIVDLQNLHLAKIIVESAVCMGSQQSIAYVPDKEGH